MLNLTDQVSQLEKIPFDWGGLADIHRGHLTRSNGEIEVVAIKVVRVRKTRHPPDLKELKRRVIKEGDLWSRLYHPNIVPFLGIFYDSGHPDLPRLVCPYYKNGNVWSYLQRNPIVDKLNLVCQVAAGLSYLHGPQIHVIHGDIKACNILVSDTGQALLADFGLARILEHSGLTSNPSRTCRWMAPELFSGLEGKIPRLTAATDTWAFTMTVLEMFTGRMPFSHLQHDVNVLWALANGELPRRDRCPEVSPEVWAILQQCWTSGCPRRRLSMRVLSLMFNILSSLRRKSGSIPALSPLAILDALERKEDEQRVMRLRQSEWESGIQNIANTLLLAGRYRQKDSKCGWDSCIFGRIRRRWTTSDKRTTGKIDGKSFSSGKLADAPYPCQWPSCGDRFNSLEKCQDHETRHIM